MLHYEFPGLGKAAIERNGEYGYDRWKWWIYAEEPGGKVFKTWITAPKDWDEDAVLSAALDAISQEVEEATGDDTGNEWGLIARDLAEGEEFAASFSVSHTLIPQGHSVYGNEWRKLHKIRKGDITSDGYEIVVAPIRYLGDCGMYAVKDPVTGVVTTDYWLWDDELRMQRRSL